MDQTIGILGQAILVLVGMALVLFLVFAILLMIKGIRRLSRELRQPVMPAGLRRSVGMSGWRGRG